MSGMSGAEKYELMMKTEKKQNSELTHDRM